MNAKQDGVVFTDPIVYISVQFHLSRRGRLAINLIEPKYVLYLLVNIKDQGPKSDIQLCHLKKIRQLLIKRSRHFIVSH